MTTNNNDNAAASTTAIQEVDFNNLDDLLGISNSSIISAEDIKPTVLKSDNVDISFLDNDNFNNPEINKDKEITPDIVSQIVDADFGDDVDDSKPVNTGGRPKIVKDAMIEAANRLIEKGILQPFDDDKSISDYTVDDFEELIQANIDNQVNTTAQNAPLEVFKQLPEEVQAVVNYALNGGTDLKNVFNQLSKAQETFDLDVKNEVDQETIVRQWMHALGSDSVEEIEDEINLLKDRGDLQKYAERYKPKLDSKQAELIEKRLKDQQVAEQRKQEQVKNYQNVIYNTLNTNNLNGVPLNSKVQNMLYYGLVDSSKYQNIEGKPTNALGYLLEQHQFGKNANPSLVAEALWLLADPDDYRNSIKQLGTKEANLKTVKMLKTEEATKNAASSTFDAESTRGKSTPTRQANSPLKRNGKNIFSR
jgi:hypothetical protein